MRLLRTTLALGFNAGILAPMSAPQSDVDRTVDHRCQQPPPGLTGGALEAALGS